MNSLFKRISEYSDTWQIFQSEYEGKPISVRFREGLIEAGGHFDYPYQIGIATQLLNSTTEGLTTNDEAEELYKVEDALQLSLEVDDESVLSLIITTGGMREFVFYASKWQPEYFEEKVRKVNSQYNNRVLQFMMQEDKEWGTFKNFLPVNTKEDRDNKPLKSVA